MDSDAFLDFENTPFDCFKVSICYNTLNLYINKVAKRRDKKKEVRIVKERVKILFQQAEIQAAENKQDKADEHIQSAFRLSKRYNLPFTQDEKKRICKHCKAYLTSKNSARRLNSMHKRIEITCNKCKKKTFIPYGGKTDKKIK